MKAWKEYCEECKRHHIVANKECPSCGVYTTPQPISEKVYERHLSPKYQCDGCQAYKEHLI